MDSSSKKNSFNRGRSPFHYIQIHLSTAIVLMFAFSFLSACGNPAPHSGGVPWTTGSYLNMIAKACFMYAQDSEKGDFPDDPAKQLIPKYLSSSKSFSPATLAPGATITYLPGFGEKDESQSLLFMFESKAGVTERRWVALTSGVAKQVDESEFTSLKEQTEVALKTMNREYKPIELYDPAKARAP